MANPNIRNKNHTVGKDEKSGAKLSTPFSVPRYFSRGSDALDASYVHKASRSVIPLALHTHSTRLESQVSICRMRSRSPSSNIRPDQFESLTRSSAPLCSLKKGPKGRAETRRQPLFISHPRRVLARAKDIMETNRLRVERGPPVSLSLSHTPRVISSFSRLLPFSYVVFDLSWIDETRDIRAARHRQQAEAKRDLNERKRMRGERKGERDGEIKKEVDTTCCEKQGKEREGTCESPEGIHRRFAMSKFAKSCRTSNDGLFDAERGRLPARWSSFEYMFATYELSLFSERVIHEFTFIVEADCSITKFYRYFV